jgi:CubicO group peptidase (beta-lactamase class C family)
VPPTAAVATTPAASISLPVTSWAPPKLDSDRRAKFDKIVPELDKLFAEAQRASKAPGLAIGIVVGGEAVYAKGFGLRDVEGKKPFTPDTPFPIASVTKSFTAMAILKLRDEGKLELDVPASRYYPPLAKLAYVTRDAPPVTLRHLLTHTSGMPEDNPWADVTENLTDADLAAMLDNGVMSRPPGARFEYANTGYAVLGRVIEQVSGTPMREYIRRAILEPLGMSHGGWEAGDVPAGTVAVGYRGREGSRDIDAPAVVAPVERLGIMDASGGIYTTVSDLSRYVAFHLSAWPPRDDADSGPLRRSTLREMQQGSVSADLREMVPSLTQRWPMTIAGAGPEGPSLHALSYGFGLMSHTTCETTFVEHSGGLPGYQTFLTMMPREGAGMFVFVNDERARANVIAPAIKMMRAAGLLVARPVEPDPGLAASVTGVHALLAHWDDVDARALFEPSFFRYQTIETLKERFAALNREHGSCRLEGQPSYVNRLRGSFREACDRGSIHFAAALAPGRKPKLQALESREDMPPSPALQRAATSLAALLENWSSRDASTVLAAAGDTPKLEREFAKLSLVHGACKIQRAVESDGKSRATFAFSCKERPLELSLMLDPSGRVAKVSGRPPRSETAPNCAE